MKYIKLFMLVVVASLFASCSDDDDYNSKEATVGFESATVVTSEGAGLMEIPVLVDGKYRNGDIRFHIELEEVGNEPAVKDSMYYITGYDFNIPADSLIDRVNIELVMINDRIPTEARQFKINIVGLKGANPGIMSTTVIVNDNDGDEYTYESMFGKYNLDMNFIQNDPMPVLAVANMGGAATADDARYNKELKLTTNASLGGLGVVNCTFPMSFEFDNTTREGTIGFMMNRKIATISNGEKTFEFVLLNTENGKETEAITAPFVMKKSQLKDANGNVVNDKNGNPIEYNSPDVIKFPLGTKAMMYQIAGQAEDQGNFGFFQFKTLTYVD